jgi:Fur family ferric uptake transcriptional regulator
VSWVEEAQEGLRRAGYRPGAAGKAVLDYLAAQDCCRGAQEIHEALTARGDRIGLASVYRMVDRLAEQGLLQRIDIGDGIVRYEPAGRADHHHHLVCGDCGKVEPFEDDRLERELTRVASRLGYAMDAHDVVLRGACDDCR